MPDRNRDIHSLSDLKQNTSEFLRQLKATGRPVVRLTWRTDSAEAESGRGTTVRPGGKEVGETR